MFHTRRRTLIALAGPHHGPARRDAPPDDTTAGDTGNGGAGDGTTEPPKPKFEGEFDPERAQRAIANAREAERAARATAAEANDRLAKVMAAIGKNPDGTDLDDPEAYAQELAERASEAEARAWRAGVQLAVHNVAGKHSVDAARLLDSMSFVDMLDDLVDEDPDSADFKAAIDKAVKDYADRNPHIKTTRGQGPARMGAEHTGGGGRNERPRGLGAAVDRHYQ